VNNRTQEARNRARGYCGSLCLTSKSAGLFLSRLAKEERDVSIARLNRTAQEK
jgi:hypothetical protein